MLSYTDRCCLIVLFIYFLIICLFFLDIASNNHRTFLLFVAKLSITIGTLLGTPHNKIRKLYPGKLIGVYFVLLDDYAKMLWSLVLNSGVTRGGGGHSIKTARRLNQGTDISP